MKKHKVKTAVFLAMKIYYESGLTCTANKVKDRIYKALDKLYSQK